MHSRRVLVTGAAGFIASHLVDALRAAGCAVVALDCSNVRPRDDANIEVCCVDLGDPDVLHKALSDMGQVDGIFHLGARLPVKNEEREFTAVNVRATQQLLEAFLASSAGFFSFASSFSVFGRPAVPVTERDETRPDTPYGSSKEAAERICEEARARTGRRIYALRMASPYGPGMSTGSVLPLFVGKALQNEDITLYGRGERTQNFVHVRDVVGAFARTATHGRGGVYNVGGAGDVSMLDLARYVVAAVPGCTSKIVFDDAAGDEQASYRWRLDLSKSARELGYWPAVGLEEGLRKYVKSLQAKTYEPWWVEE